MKLRENSITVLENRYLTRDEKGNLIETPEQLFRRVAKYIASGDKIYNKEPNIEKTEEEFYNMMANLEFMPNSPTLMNAGKELGQLSACFVLPIGDSMEEIFDAIKNAALIHKSGGGTGFSFSRLRPSGSTVKSTGGVASGPISFMKVFNSATEAVKQGGTRRGANMGILRVDHPDIMDFISCKKDTSEITNFNISVGLTEEFMNAVEKDEEYSLIDPHTKKITSKLKAKEVFDHIIEMAWTNGEPGIIFLDRINKTNPTPQLGEVESTNPCGEQPLLPYESCNLGSINLDSMLIKKDNGYEIDYEKLGKTVEKSVHFLDNVIDVNKYPLNEIDDMTKKTRKIGLGIMGFADVLFKLKVPYNSQPGVDLARKIMKYIDDKSKEASIKLAKERGTFSAYEESIYKDKDLEFRNATTTTIAPTGTISIISGVSSGIEPLFAISFVRNVMDNDKLIEVHPYFEEIAKERGFYSEDLMEKIAEAGTLAHIKEVPEDIKRIFVTAHDISPEWHIKMQAAFQEYVDNAVSKTVNFTSDATREDVREVYTLAYKLGCKGVTIYRDGSRQSQVLSVGKKDETKNENEEKKSKSIQPRQRPDITQGITEKASIGCGSLYVSVNYDEEGICEVFTNVGKAGGCPSQSEATSRIISIALRAGMDPKSIIEQLKGIRCHSTLRQRANNKDIKVLSCPDAIGKALEKVLNTYVDIKDSSVNDIVRELEEEINEIPKPTGNLIEEELQKSRGSSRCPECNSKITHESGCVICPNCGFSRCG
ncbi:ribonucleoside-diphosphate reductase NrdZ [Gottschalkia acidurici 9a]|uniref:Vitamin B12-dependent ribonucleotide reductase n=1 Tax=Gottschalkia acidurici (strain ATCC 7906 / DSM 604 / BCRC 14475 / CIP 104303 / KCTC 5404 / NCIMB 10678 / 9a) TaxID=1128398 RepID=K0B1I5_GOTA9|nr:vitamin B12-dependent ribonucleotide reductase [Gottschalkia acidurici]AFS79349.1 ribonucleoside-diphosphate reductase NrdZ [Gottschalkia acidurici 9a]